MALIVNEIFHSIQGESLHSGRPCTFIRLTGCNLRCSYCDTRYAYEEGVPMAIAQILERINVYGCTLVEVTGGEPLFQNDTPLLIERLLATGYDVMMETNGSFDISKVDQRCLKIVDIKCPSSGQSENNDLENLKRLDFKDQVKFVIGNREDYEYAIKIMRLMPAKLSLDRVLFSPVFGKLAPADLARWILDDNLDVRLHLQLHKIVWPGASRGF